jgi:hypothetical protein
VSTIAISSAISCEAGVEPRQHAGQHLGREPLQVAHADALEHLRDPHAQRVGPLVGRAAHAEDEVGVGVLGELAAGHEARLVGGAPELVRGRARHQRAVEVEEGRARLVGPPQGAAAGRRRQDVRALGQTWTITASPWPPPEQIAAQP